MPNHLQGDLKIWTNPQSLLFGNNQAFFRDFFNQTVFDIFFTQNPTHVDFIMLTILRVANQEKES